MTKLRKADIVGTPGAFKNDEIGGTLPRIEEINIKDFTEDEYRQLLRLAKSKYKFIEYKAISENENFVLWRHDVDSSLNRALRLAEIEREEGVSATYFINPHCQFYNFIELSQYQIIKKIVGLGHAIGLHFDSEFYSVKNEDELDALVAREAKYLADCIGVDIDVFSFHNPDNFLLSCDREAYGGLINCYSARFKSLVSYCSDSNGYWRFKPLRRVLEDALDPRLQVLTHPEWWQAAAQHPRGRIFRSISGRAAALLQSYDRTLLANGRSNLSGPVASVAFLREFDIGRHELYDHLWNKGQHETLLVELFRLHKQQVRSMGEALLNAAWKVPHVEVESFFKDAKARGLSGGDLFKVIFETSWANTTGSTPADYRSWTELCEQLLNGGSEAFEGQAEKGSVFFCGAIERLAAWGRAKQDLRSSGLANHGSSRLLQPQAAVALAADQKVEATPFYLNAWIDLKARCASHAGG